MTHPVTEWKWYQWASGELTSQRWTNSVDYLLLIKVRAFEAKEEIKAHCDDYRAMMSLRMERAYNRAMYLPKYFKIWGTGYPRPLSNMGNSTKP